MRDRAEQASGLRMALEVFRRRRWLALTAFALCLGGAGGLALFLPDIYRARVTVMVDHQLDAQARPAQLKTLHAGEPPHQVEANLATLQGLNSRPQLNSQNPMRAWDRRASLAPDPAGSLSTGETGSLAARIASLRRELADLRRRYR